MKVNQQDIQSLTAILASEAELFTSFVDLLDRQRDAIVANDTDKLNTITELQRDKFAESRILDTRRQQLIVALKAQSASNEDLTVSALLDLVSAEDGRTLARLRETILSLNETIDTGRQRNSFLIEKSRSLISETLKLFNRVGSKRTQGSAYTARATSSPVHPDARMSLALDRKA